MDASSRDEAPMLPASHLQSDNGGSSTRRGISGRMRSVSMSFATESPHPSEYQQNLVGYTGPLRAAKRNPQVQMSGPLHPNRNNEVVFRPPQKAAEPENRARNGDGDYVGKNEHLWRSGKLGKCSDPYCTACPMFQRYFQRYESPHWRGIAARRIQLAWRHRRKQTNRVDSSRVGSSRSPHNLLYRTRSRRK